MKKYSPPILITVLVLLLFFTNPTNEKHKAIISQRCNEQNPVSGLFGLCGLGTAILEYYDYYLFSYTQMPAYLNQEKPITSIGIGGMVFILN